MTAVAAGLAERNIATLRYQFPYMKRGGKRPDPPKLAQAAVRAAVAEASRLQPGVLLIAGGKSFGGRMTSQAQAVEPLPGVRGLAFLGFPLHPAGRPSKDRTDHLFKVRVPMLFLQGTRDALADLGELKPLCEALGSNATLKLFGGRGPFVSRAGPQRALRCAGAGRTAGCAGQLDCRIRLGLRARDALSGWISRRICESGYDAPLREGTATRVEHLLGDTIANARSPVESDSSPSGTPPRTKATEKFQIEMTVNGVPMQQREVAPWTTLLDFLRDISTHRHEERLRPRSMRRLHRLGKRPAHQFLYDLRGHAGGARHHDRGARRQWRRCIPCSRPLSITTPFNAGIARPGRFARPRAAREGKAKTDGRNSRTYERQHLPLRRLPQHRRSHSASHGAIMINFEYVRATDVADAVRRIAAYPGAKFIAGGTNLIDLMKEDVERPSEARRHLTARA